MTQTLFTNEKKHYELKLSKRTCWGIITLIVTIIAFCVMLRIWNRDLTCPVWFTGDSACMNNINAKVIQRDFDFCDEKGQYPFGSTIFLGSDGLFTEFVSMLLAWFTGNLGYTAWLWFGLQYIFTALFTYYALLKLSVIPELSCLGSITFNFIPYHYFRVGHQNLDNTSFIPIILCAVILCVCNYEKLNKTFLIFTMLLCFLQGMTSIYTSLFLCSAVFYGILYILISHKNEWKKVGILSAMMGMMMIGIPMSSIISNRITPLVTTNQGGQILTYGLLDSGGRTLNDVNYYSLRIYTLFLPNYGHPINLLDTISTQVYNYADSWVADVFTEPLCTFMCLGLLLCLIYCFKKKKEEKEELHFIPYWVLFLIAVSICYGFNLFLGLINSGIRSYNRMSILIACLCMFFLIIKLNMFIQEHQVLYKYRILSVFLLIAFVLFDQISGKYATYRYPHIYYNMEWRNLHEDYEADYKKNKFFFEELNSLMKGKEVVYEGIQNWKMSYALIFSPDVWFNYNMTYIDQPYRELYNIIKTFPLEEKCGYYATLGYEGFLVDANDEQLSGIETLLGKPVFYSDGFYCFSLEEFAKDREINTYISIEEAKSVFYDKYEELVVSDE